MLRLLVSLIAVALIQGLAAIGLLLQWAPQIVRAAWLTLFVFVSLSCVVYRAVLMWLALRLGWGWLVRQPMRLAVCVALSNGLAVGLCLALSWPVTPLGAGLATVHGIIVSAAWDELGPPRGQSLGR
jgi:hypothetical protein